MTPAAHYLISCAGVPNYGDELIAASWLRYLARAAPQQPVVVDCISPENAKLTLGPLHPAVRFTDTVWTLALEAQRDDVWESVRGVAAAVHHGQEPGVRALLEAESIHLVGGGLLNGIYAWTMGLLTAAVVAAELGGGTSAVTGQGLCPQRPETLPVIRDLFARLDVADVRDEGSAQLLDLPGVSVTSDDVFLVPGPWLHRPADDAPELIVCAQSEVAPTREVPATPAQDVAEFITSTLQAWGIPAHEVLFLECFPGLDTTIHQLVQARMPGVGLAGIEGLLRDGVPIRPGQTWISTRFHPHLVGALAGASGVALSVVPDYYDIKHASLIEQGSGWTLTRDWRVPDRPHGHGFDPSTIRSLSAAKRAVAERIYPSTTGVEGSDTRPGHTASDCGAR